MKPILFNTPMVQAILAGRKTQTRRMIEPQPCPEALYFNKLINIGGRGGEARFSNNSSGAVCDIKLRYDVGDILWVRERYREFCGMTYCWQGGAYIPAYDFGGIQYFADSAMRRTDEGCFGVMFLPSEDVKTDIEYGKWRPSIFMPREAARIFLRVTDVRAERVQDITIADAKAEGVTCNCPDNEENRCYKGNIGHYRVLWDSLNAKRGCGWDANPWVWAISFERVGELV